LIEIVKNPGNSRLNNLNDPILNVLRCLGRKIKDGDLKHFVNLFCSLHEYDFVHLLPFQNI